MAIKSCNICDECKIKMKKARLYKSKILCSICYRKKFIIITTPPGIFEEPCSLKVAFFLSLTPTQKILLDERIKYLFPKQKNSRTKYLRALVMGDIQNWEMIKNETKKRI